ncbi:MAG: hypothetical protein ACTHKV_12130, partial [Flavipsychrobacter sp.]
MNRRRDCFGVWLFSLIVTYNHLPSYLGCSSYEQEEILFGVVLFSLIVNYNHLPLVPQGTPPINRRRDCFGVWLFSLIVTYNHLPT